MDKEENKLFIIARLYTKGTLVGLKWVDENYSDEDVIEAAQQRRDLTPIVANYLRKKIWVNKRRNGVLPSS